jgi:multiple sugar transport system permease protein
MRSRTSDVVAPAVLVAPALITLGVWIYFPLFEAAWLSLFDWNLMPTADKVYVGLENYARLLTLPEFGKASLNTVYYTVGLLPLTVGLPLAVALATQRLEGPARNFYRAVIFLPMIMAPVVVAVIWRWLLNPDFGLVNQVITGLGFPAVRFLSNTDTALWVILLLTGWKLVGFSTLVFSAAITQVDSSLTEAAKMDGAGDLRLSFDIVIPLIAPAIAFIALLTVLHGAQWSFVYINLLTQGGPLQSTTNLFYLMYDYGFGNFSVGWSTAAGMILFVAFGAIAAVCLRLARRSAAYQT